MSAPERQIKPLTAASMVVACMIGTGVFTSIGYQLPDLPAVTPVLLLWLMGGVLALCGAFCYAELVSMLPRSGGEYHLLREAYHPFVGFLAGWVSLVAGFAAPIALAAMAFGTYLHAFGLEVQPTLLGVALVVLMTAINLAKPSLLQRFLTGATAMKVLLIVAFILGAFLLPGGVRNDMSLSTADLHLCWSTPFAISLIYVMYAYEGWNGAAYVAGEVEQPARNLPRVLIAGTLLVTLLYIALNAVFLWRGPWEQMRFKQEAALIVAESIFGPTGGKLMGGLIAAGLISTVATMLCAGSRVNERMGQDVAFLAPLARRDQAGTPYVAVLLVAAFAILMLVTQTFDEVQRYVECLLILSSSLAVFGVIWLRIRRPHAERPFRTPLYPLTPLLFLAMAAHMLIKAAKGHPQDLLLGGATLLVGAAVYGLGHLRSPRGHL
jgi:basic amino acid/polyamine antiporter, APA family